MKEAEAPFSHHHHQPPRSSSCLLSLPASRIDGGKERNGKRLKERERELYRLLIVWVSQDCDTIVDLADLQFLQLASRWLDLEAR